MIRLLLLAALALVFACNQSNQNHFSVSDSIVDTVTFPDYYTHPEITDINQLRDLLYKADKVLAFNYNGHNGNSANVGCVDLYSLPDKKLCSSAGLPRVLNNSEIDSLINITCDTATYTGDWSGLAGVCFIPHLGFGFFKSDSLIAQVNVCFLCGGIRTRPYYCSDGLSRSGGMRLAALTKKLGLEIVDGSTDLSY